MDVSLSVVLDAVRIGRLRSLPPEGQATGIHKEPVAGPVRVTTLGLVGDEHGDRRVHGGPEKALHYFSVEGYERLASALGLVGSLHPGDLGENLGGRGATERTVCVGDVFRIGTATAQVSRPRSPCWRIDHRLGVDGANLLLAQLRCQGWYLRVLEEGEVAAGDWMTLLERPSPDATIDRLLEVQQQDRPDPVELRELASATGLTPEISRRLSGRAEWLERNT